MLARDMGNRILEQGRRAVTHGWPVLDLPVGTAYFTKTWAQATSTLVVGADIAPGMVTAAARTVSANPQVVIAQADAHRMPFATGSFGAVMCTNGLQVMPERRGVVQEIARVLRPDGKLYLTLLTLPLSAVLPRSVHENLPAVLLGRTALERMLADAGFRDVEIRRSRFAWFIEARPSQPGT